MEHEITRWALREAFAKIADFALVGEARSLPETLELVRREKPDVVLVDAMLSDRSGRDAVNELRDLDAGPLVVMLAAHDEAFYGVGPVSSGVHAYVRRSATPDQLLETIRAVCRGERVIPPDIEALAGENGHPASLLTRRELQVMEMIARGMTNREIAEHLEISVKTVDTHRGHLMKKLALRNNSDLTRFALKHGYVSV
jgi:two-component system, NarL family, invasion response regulator UvrY